jgi:hypothetical protein
LYVKAGKSNEGGFYKAYGSDADGEKGYLKKTFSKGDHGYKTLDTFHKKLGDRYGFEEHEAFGKASGKESEGQEGKSASAKRKLSNDHEGAGTLTTFYRPFIRSLSLSLALELTNALTPALRPSMASASASLNSTPSSVSFSPFKRIIS